MHSSDHRQPPAPPGAFPHSPSHHQAPAHQRQHGHHGAHDDGRRQPNGTNSGGVIRRRSGGAAAAAALSSSLRRLDLFPKVDSDHRRAGTSSGGAVALCGAAVCVLLSGSEVYSHLSHDGGSVEHLTVHKRLETELEIAIDVEFPRVQCDELTVDAIDIGGDVSSLDDDGTLRKVRAGSRGCRASGTVTVNRVGGMLHFRSSAAGAGFGDKDDDGADDASSAGDAKNDGRRDDAGNFDSSHVVHELRFGPKRAWSSGGCFPRRRAERDARSSGGTGLFTYYSQLVPRTHLGWNADGSGGPVESSTPLDSMGCVVLEKFEPYTVGIPPAPTDGGGDADNANAKEEESDAADDASDPQNHHAHQTLPEETGVLPGVLFQYELFPFSMEVTRRSAPPLTHLLIRLAAVVGGVVTLMGWMSELMRLGGRRSKSSSHR